MPRLATIGAYGFTAQEFLATLLEAEVTVLLDVRQRRGLRGTEYAWANAKRLQAALAETAIEYRHLPELAPTTELRQLQYAADDLNGVGKRSRDVLAPEYVERYEREILAGAPLPELPQRGLAALFCVERDPEACHRSLIADAIAGQDVLHLRPPAT
ncbi:MAG: DUF488 family protein [Solirubrobacteraceae bacterium]